MSGHIPIILMLCFVWFGTGVLIGSCLQSRKIKSLVASMDIESIVREVIAREVMK